MKEMYPRALEIATQAHFNQWRRAFKQSGIGKIPYISHPVAVATKFDDDFSRTVGVLHDVIEDAPEFSDTILKEFPEEVFNTVTLLSRIPKETYFDFIMRIKNSGDIVAINVKIVDITENLKTIEEGATADKYRLAKYILLTKLSETKRGMSKICENYL